MPIIIWVIFLKNKIFNKKIFKRAFIIFCCGALFFALAYTYLKFNLEKETQSTEQKDYTVPYEKTPENKGIVFVFPNNSAVLVYLDFESSGVRLLDIESFDSARPEYYGYAADYTVQTSYELIEGIIDRVGGIDIEQNGETLRYTGVQVIDLIAHGYDGDLKKQILLQIFEQISKNNFSKEDFVYIIENSESNLSFIDCIYWLDYIEEMCDKIYFVN